MLAMAILAACGGFTAFKKGQAMHTRAKAFRLLAVASPAIDRLRGGRVVRMLGSEIGMAASALDFSMRRHFECGLVHKKRSRFPVWQILGQVLVTMALKAFVVRNCQNLRPCRE